MSGKAMGILSGILVREGVKLQSRIAAAKQENLPQAEFIAIAQRENAAFQAKSLELAPVWENVFGPLPDWIKEDMTDDEKGQMKEAEEEHSATVAAQARRDADMEEKIRKHEEEVIATKERHRIEEENNVKERAERKVKEEKEKKAREERLAAEKAIREARDKEEARRTEEELARNRERALQEKKVADANQARLEAERLERDAEDARVRAANDRESAARDARKKLQCPKCHTPGGSGPFDEHVQACPGPRCTDCREPVGLKGDWDEKKVQKLYDKHTKKCAYLLKQAAPPPAASVAKSGGSGGSKPLEPRKKPPCGNCKGSGQARCDRCNGRRITAATPCTKCKATGIGRCDRCFGKGE